MKNNNAGKAKNAFINYCNVWGSRNPRTLEDLKEIVDEIFTGIGTAKHEIFHNPFELFRQWEKETQQITNETYNIVKIDENFGQRYYKPCKIVR